MFIVFFHHRFLNSMQNFTPHHRIAIIESIAVLICFAGKPTKYLCQHSTEFIVKQCATLFTEPDRW